MASREGPGRGSRHSELHKQERIDRGEIAGLSTEEALDLAAAKRRIKQLETELAAAKKVEDRTFEFGVIGPLPSFVIQAGGSIGLLSILPRATIVVSAVALSDPNNPGSELATRSSRSRRTPCDRSYVRHTEDEIPRMSDVPPISRGALESEFG